MVSSPPMVPARSAAPAPPVQPLRFDAPWLVELEAACVEGYLRLGMDFDLQAYYHVHAPPLFRVVAGREHPLPLSRISAPDRSGFVGRRRRAASESRLTMAREALQEAAAGRWPRAKALARTAEREGPRTDGTPLWQPFRRALDRAARRASRDADHRPLAPMPERLREAIRRDDAAAVQHLLQLGADPEDRHQGQTPLALALTLGRSRIAWFLLHLGGADPNAADEGGEYPLHLAARLENLAVLESLLEAGADVDVRNRSKATPLSVAAVMGKLRPVQLLLECGADADAPGFQGRTPLLEAAGGGHRRLLELLLSAGAEVNAADAHGHTALGLAAYGGHASAVAALLEAGADPHRRDLLGRTALMQAAERGSARCVALLLEAGADPRMVDHFGHRSALRMAEEWAGLELGEALQRTVAERFGARRAAARVRRRRSRDGERVVEVTRGRGDAIDAISRCDHFDEVVRLLKRYDPPPRTLQTWHERWSAAFAATEGALGLNAWPADHEPERSAR